MSRYYLPKERIAPLRARWVSCAILMGFLAVVFAGFARLQWLQETLEERFWRMHYASSVVPAHRGSIYGRDGPLAMSSDIYHITMAPRVLRRENSSAAQYRRQSEDLAQALDMSPATVLEKMQSDRGFLYLKKNVPAGAAEYVKSLDIPGIDAEYISKRFYPDGMNFAHVIGYTDWQGIGRAGIEHVHHKRLDAADGEIRYLRAGSRGVVSELQHQPATPGNNVHLTLERGMQYLTFSALAAAVHKHQAASASAIVMDVTDGSILALANYPSFNPNFIRAEDKHNQLNHALADQVEPGSTVKPFVAALALELQLTRPDEVFATKQAIRIADLRVFDQHVREDLDVRGIIRKSSNVGVVQLARRIGAPKLEMFYRQLGFGQGKLLHFREEAKGVLRPNIDWRETDFATHAYGYGFSLTLPQLLQAYSVFAADGVLVPPRLWRDAPAAARRRVLSEGTAREVRSMLEAVVSDEGTARRAAIAGYRVAGKTGTTGKWTDGRFDLSRRRVFFVGMAPASRPRYVIAVMVDEPKRQGDSGGAVAAPLFRQIMQKALLFGGVPPDNLGGDGGAAGEQV